MAVILSMELGYPTTTLARRSVEAVDYEERSRWWTKPSGNVVSLIPPRDPDHGGSAA